MKTRLRSTLPAALACASALVFLSPQPTFADSGHDHDAQAAGGHGDSVPAGSYSSTSQAWATVKKSVSAASQAIGAGDLKPVHEASEQLDGAVKYLQTAGGIADADKKLRAEATLKQLLTLSGELHIAADAGDSAKSASALKKIEGVMKLIEIQYPAEALVAPLGTAAMSHGGGHPASATIATTKVAVTTAKPLTVGQEATATVKLTKPDGSPMLLSDLKEAHTEKIHLLINDLSLSDYHHEHPTATKVPGEYAFAFTPSKPGPYRVWADLVPLATDAQEYAIADIAASTKSEPISQRTPSTSVEVDGLNYAVTFDNPVLKAGEAVLGKLTITKSDGTPFNALEPVMGAYAHIVGFGEDGYTIAHVHPMGAEPEKASDRGIGELKFHLVPAAGLMRLYAQIRVNGEDKFAPFTLEIARP